MLQTSQQRGVAVYSECTRLPVERLCACTVPHLRMSGQASSSEEPQAAEEALLPQPPASRVPISPLSLLRARTNNGNTAAEADAAEPAATSTTTSNTTQRDDDAVAVAGSAEGRHQPLLVAAIAVNRVVVGVSSSVAVARSCKLMLT